MNKNILKEQVEKSYGILLKHLDHYFSDEMRDLMTMAEIFDNRAIYIIGSGDSLAVGFATKDLLEKYCDCFGVKVVEPLEFTRYMSQEEIGIGEPNSPLVIGISSSGKSVRLIEALRKANAIGAFSILLTNAPDSPAGIEAKRVFDLKTPHITGGIGYTTYLSSILGMIGFTWRFGVVRGTLTPQTRDLWLHEIRGLFTKTDQDLKTMDSVVKDFMDKNSHPEIVDFIGDSLHKSTAHFGAAKIVESAGGLAASDDSENWCHIHTFFKNPECIPTIVITNQYSASYSRVIETVKQAAGIQRPLLVIGDVIEEDFSNQATTIALKGLTTSNAWLQPLIDAAPVALLAGYNAETLGTTYFRQDIEGEANPMNYQTIYSSEIVIYK